jgi:cephalosporin-C deacetylase-like acetyl esterase
MKKLLLTMLLLPISLFAVEYKWKCSTNKPDAIYRTGEEIVFKVQLMKKSPKGDFSPTLGHKVKYYLFDGTKRTWGSFISSQKPFILKTSMTFPGWTYCIMTPYEKDGKTVCKRRTRSKRLVTASGGVGAFVEPDKFVCALPEPEDFDKFWKVQRAELNKVPIRAKLTPVKLSPSRNRQEKAYDVQIDCLGGKNVSGHLVIPAGAKPKSLPAIVAFDGAGVRSAWIPHNKNAISLAINAHGIPNRKPAAFYQKLKKTTLKNYRYAGKSSRDTLYFRGMYLRVMRALDYVKSLPEWDGKHLIVIGTSQGGGQAIAAAALDPQVTFCRAGVPALSDHSGALSNPPHRSGWPRFYRSKEKADPKVVKAASYYDNVYFARRIKAPCYLSAGLIDTVCAPYGIYLVYLNLPDKDKKAIHITPDKGHDAPNPTGQNALNTYIKQCLLENKKGLSD